MSGYQTPGEMIEALMVYTDTDIEQVSRALNLSRMELREIINGYVDIAYEDAQALTELFNSTTLEEWLTLQARLTQADECDLY